MTKCRDCDGGLCPECEGSGDEAQASCEHCDAKGTCPTCKGTGTIGEAPVEQADVGALQARLADLTAAVAARDARIEVLEAELTELKDLVAARSGA